VVDTPASDLNDDELFGPLHPLARHSGRLLNEMSHARIASADNLLRKALAALEAGNAERAPRN
jgi:hypothetical protein